jgi:hypothetical protein
MNAPGLDQVRAWIAQAARAPSAHNVQPARWRLHEGRLELWEDTGRWLPAGDASGRDAGIALGMAWEGMVLAAGAQGWSLGDPGLDAAPYPPAPAPRRRAAATLERGGRADPLAAFVSRRHCCRRKFRAATTHERSNLDAVFATHPGIAFPADGAALEGFAVAQQAASIDLLRDRSVGAELYSWLRLSRRHPQVARDGLDAACLELGSLEAIGGRVLMRPAIASTLATLGLGGLLVDEAAKVRSATAIAVLAVPAGVGDFEAGRRWYRFWLALAGAGFAAVPMSALVDTPGGRDALATVRPLPEGWRAINVMRIGPAPETLPISARLPVAELMAPATVA